MITIKRVGRSIAAALVLAACSAFAAAAQAVITGRVTDAQGIPIPGANVVFPSLGVGVGANTNTDGNYTVTLSSSHAGQSMVITARRIGFSPLSRTITLAS